MAPQIRQGGLQPHLHGILNNFSIHYCLSFLISFQLHKLYKFQHYVEARQLLRISKHLDQLLAPRKSCSFWLGNSCQETLLEMEVRYMAADKDYLA